MANGGAEQGAPVPQSTLQPHQERVVIEKLELDEKLAKLKAFAFGGNPIFGTLPPEERDRLERQFDAMSRYSAILGERIAAFERTVSERE
jgi:hypothetical protein